MFNLSIISKIAMASVIVVIGFGSYKYFCIKQNNATRYVSEEVIRLEPVNTTDLNTETKQAI